MWPALISFTLALVLLQLAVGFRLYRKENLLKVLFSVLSLICEKNAHKVLTLDTPIVLSARRCTLVAVTVAVVRMIWRAPNLGWPDASLAMAVVIAPALLEALAKVDPKAALEFGKTLLGRFGIGAVRGDTPADHETMVERADHA